MGLLNTHDPRERFKSDDDLPYTAEPYYVSGAMNVIRYRVRREFYPGGPWFLETQRRVEDGVNLITVLEIDEHGQPLLDGPLLDGSQYLSRGPMMTPAGALRDLRTRGLVPSQPL